MTKTQQIVDLFNEFGKKMKKNFCSKDEVMSKLSVSHVRVLQLLSDTPRMSMADIAKGLGITPASTTSLVDKMVQQAWLVRIADENDRRKVYIEIEPEKKESWGKCYANALDQIAKKINVLSEDQKDQFIQILNILNSTK